MDSKIVNRHIRSEIRPFLRKQGFTQFTGRNSWRYGNAHIDVINFQSFNSYNASVMGCTTYSFGVNLGCFHLDIPNQYGADTIKRKGDVLRPEEYECHFRRRLTRGFPQPEYEARDVWYVDPEGEYLEKALHDVRMAIARDGLAWFQRLSDPAEVLRVLMEEEEDMERLWGFGNNPSPARHYLTAYFALRLSRWGIAEHHFREVLESGCFEQVSERLERDLERAAQLALAPVGAPPRR